MTCIVDVPVSAAELFSDRSGHGGLAVASVSKVATILGFEGAKQLETTLSTWWPFWATRTQDVISPAEFVALVQLLQFKTLQANKLQNDLMVGGRTRTVQMLTYPVGVTADRGAQQARDPPWVMCQPEDVGMDWEPLEKCRQYLHYRIARKHFAGVVGGVVKDGKLVYFDAAGYADIETKAPMREDTIMRLFSMSKCIVVVAFLAYAEDPKLGIDLDDPVWKYIPSWKALKLAPKRGSTALRDLDTGDQRKRKEKLPPAPTLRHLLTHTAGLGYGPTLGDDLPPKNTDHYKIYWDLMQKTHAGKFSSLAEWVDELAKVPLKVAPGSYWEYSFSTDVLGRVIEVISGKPLDVAVEEKVCGPLGMTDTCFRVPEEKADRMGAWYKRENPLDEKGNVVDRPGPGGNYRLTCIDPAGSKSGWVGDNASKLLSAGGTVELPLDMKGGMVSTFRDYLRFLLMIRNYGELNGVRVLRKETVQVMLCNQLPAATNRRTAWVFDKKGQGFNFMGQIQVQHHEKETFQQGGELKRGGNTYASLAPGTVSAEYGWGGLGGPAWTIDPRLDVIILSMTQTALELDHEENLRFSARRAAHASLFGATAGQRKVTDYPPEGHEGLKQGKLLPKTENIMRRLPTQDMGLGGFIEAELEAQGRALTMNALVVSGGNVGHELKDEEDCDTSAPSSSPQKDLEDVSVDESSLKRRPSGDNEQSAKKKRSADSPPSLADTSQDDDKRALKRIDASAKKGSPSPNSAEPGDLLFSRVAVSTSEEARIKARVTAIERNGLEVIAEDGFQTFNVNFCDVSVIDETQFAVTKKIAEDAPKDFGFLLAKKAGS